MFRFGVMSTETENRVPSAADASLAFEDADERQHPNGMDQIRERLGCVVVCTTHARWTWNRCVLRPKHLSRCTRRFHRRRPTTRHWVCSYRPHLMRYIAYLGIQVPTSIVRRHVEHGIRSRVRG